MHELGVELWAYSVHMTPRRTVLLRYHPDTYLHEVDTSLHWGLNPEPFSLQD